MQMLPLTLMGLPTGEAGTAQAQATAIPGFDAVLGEAAESSEIQASLVGDQGGACQEAGTLEPTAHSQKLDLTRDSEDEIALMWAGLPLPLQPASPLRTETIESPEQITLVSGAAEPTQISLEASSLPVQNASGAAKSVGTASPVFATTASPATNEAVSSKPGEANGFEVTSKPAPEAASEPLGTQAPAISPKIRVTDQGEGRVSKKVIEGTPQISFPVGAEPNWESMTTEGLTLSSKTPKDSQQAPLNPEGEVRSTVGTAAQQQNRAQATEQDIPTVQVEARPSSPLMVLASRAASEALKSLAQAAPLNEAASQDSTASVADVKAPAKMISFLPSSGASLVKRLMEKLSQAIQTATPEASPETPTSPEATLAEAELIIPAPEIKAEPKPAANPLLSVEASKTETAPAPASEETADQRSTEPQPEDGAPASILRTEFKGRAEAPAVSQTSPVPQSQPQTTSNVSEEVAWDSVSVEVVHTESVKAKKDLKPAESESTDKAPAVQAPVSLGDSSSPLKAASSPSLAPSQERRLVSQTEEAVRDLIAARRPGQITLRLRPHDLGEVTVKVKMEGAQVHAEVAASHEGVRQTLTSHRSDLAASLEQKGHTLSSFTVSPEKPEASSQSQFGAHQGRGQEEALNQDDFRRLSRLASLASSQPSSPQPSRYQPRHEGVNVLA